MITKQRNGPGGEVEVRQGGLVSTRHLHAILEHATNPETPQHERAYLVEELKITISELRAAADWFEAELQSRTELAKNG